MSDRTAVILFAACSGVLLVLGLFARSWAPSPWAPRIHVRWTEATTDHERRQQERVLGLFEGRPREGATWEYDLADPRPSRVQALLRSPNVADTHYLDRGAGRVAADAPRGTTPVATGRAAAWIRSAAADWLVAFSVSGLFVTGVWLASARRPGT